MMRHDNIIDLRKQDELIALIKIGEGYRPRRGPVSIVEWDPSIQHRLYDTARSLRRTGHYCVCWWNEQKKTVWFSWSALDFLSAQGGEPGVASEPEVRQAFLVHKEVIAVRVVCEAMPDPRTGELWEEVYPVPA